MSFVHLNVRTHASLLHASSQPEDVVGRAVKLGQPAVAITDYGNVSNAINFYREAKKVGVKPIMGVEVFFTEDNNEYRDQKIRQTRHLVLLAENDIGWQNIVRLVSESNTEENFFYRPRVDFSMLEKRSEGVIVIPGGPDGIISYYLYDKCTSDGTIVERAAPIKAAALLRRFQRIFDHDHIFLDVQDTGQAYERQMNDGMRDLAKKYGLRTVATNNVHYVAPHDAEAHRTLFAMNMSQYNRVTSTEFTTERFYITSREEMESTSLLPEELDITLEIAERCQVDIDLSKRRLPKYQFVPDDKTAMEYLVDICRQGYNRLGLANKHSLGDESYADRMNRELADINDMGFADYFLIIHDVVDWCKRQGMLLGHGRGSAGGSLVSYVLGITLMDPLEYGLIWERFLNKGRGGLPDIDTDVPQSRRQDVLAYIRERFGENNVAQIATYGGMKARSILKEVFRVYGVDFSIANAITALVPAKNNDHAPPTLDEALEMVPALREYESKYKAWFTIARALEGCYKSVGIHAAGVVISDMPFDESSYPLCRSAKGDSLLFAWDMNTVDTLSLLKLDILGLTNLDDIKVTMDLVAAHGGPQVSRETIPLDDQEAYAILSRGLNMGVFQLETQLGKGWSKALQPGTIEEISDLVSLIRPGPLDSGMGDQYRDVKNGSADPTYIHEKLEPILRPTKSACLYQEQVIQICRDLAGMSLIDADKVRKAMGKKKPEEMAKWREVFLAGCLSYSKIGNETADEIWGFIVTFAGYGFNKCISGKTSVIRAGANQYADREITLEELWRYFHGDLKRTPTGKKYRNKTHPNLGLRIMAMKDGRIKPDRIADVIQTGVKKTYRLKLDTGEEIRSTLDHKFWTPCGWMRLQDLSVGDTVCIGGQYEPTTVEESRKLNRFSNVKVDQRKFKSAPCFVHGKDNAAYIDGASITYKQTRLKRIKEIGHCEQCGQTANRYELAHLNGDHTNQSDDNLRLMCVSCHKKYDYQYNDRNRRFEKGYPIDAGTIVSIDDLKEEMTYDIEMCGDEHNYIANGIVTHNSHGVGYGLLSYETAYMKAHYPTEFLCAKLRHAADAEEIKQLVFDARLFDIKIVPPRVSAGNQTFDVVGKQQIAFGLTALKGVGASAISSVVALSQIAGEPSPEAFDMLLWSLFSDSHKLNSNVVKALILSGAFDDFGVQRVRAYAQYQLLSSLTPKQRDKLWELYTKQTTSFDWIRILRGATDEDKVGGIKERFGIIIASTPQRAKIRDNLAAYDATDPIDRTNDKIRWEKEYLGLGLSGSRADGFRVRNKCRDVIRDGYDGMPIEIVVEIEDFREILTKTKRQPMAFITGSDSTCWLDNIVVFPRVYERYRQVIENGAVVKVTGSIDERGSVLANELQRLV